MKLNKSKPSNSHVAIEGMASSDVKLSFDIDDDTFMAACWKRVQKQKDDAKCESCDFKFKCYTEDWGKPHSRSGV